MEVLLAVVGIALVGFAAFVGFAVWGARKAVRTYTDKGSTFEAPAYRHLSVESGATVQDVLEALDPYKRAEGVGQRASRVIIQLQDAQRKCEALQATASARFTKSSLSLDAVTDIISQADEAFDKVLRNSIALANSAQTFDVRDYHGLKRQQASAAWKRDGAPDGLQGQRLAEMEARLADMDTGLQANESLLLELDRLVANLNWLERSGQAPAAGAAPMASAVDDELRGYASRPSS